MADTPDTNAKALRINLDPAPYGTFAEIGAGQEVSRWFFRVGGAAGTVAKSMSAYDMTVSDAVYGKSSRYVSRDRLSAMLEHEHGLLVERLNAARGATTAFFVFADTVATKSHKGTNESHGWLGLRFQHAPGSETSEILVHVSLRDTTAVQQQQSLGVLGVNLIHAAYYQREPAGDMLASLMDGLTIENIEVDAVECRGPALAGLADATAAAALMLERGLTNVVVFDENGRMDQASAVLYKRGMLVCRGSIERENPAVERMLAAGAAKLLKEAPEEKRPPAQILEVSLKAALGGEGQRAASAPARLAGMLRPGRVLMATRWAETYEITQYLRRHSTEPLRYLAGVDMVVQLLRRHFYPLDGGLLEGMGRALATNVRLYAFSMPAALFRERLALYKTEPGFCSVPDKPVITLDDLKVASPGGHLLEYLRDSGWVVPAEM